jgi:hypothetical protein
VHTPYILLLNNETRGIYLKEYYGEDSLLKEFVICKVRKDVSIGKEIKAVNGIQFDF